MMSSGELERHFDLVLGTGMTLKQGMVDKGLTLAKTKCPKCNGPESLHGRLVVGQAAGRHRRSGGAFRMWCDTCADIRMME
jgi:hypothetical protein